MLDLTLFRADKGGDHFLVRESQHRRRADESIVDAILAADARWRTLQHNLEEARAAQSRARARMKPKKAKGAVDVGASASCATPVEQNEGPLPTRAELTALGADIAAAERAAHDSQAELQSMLLRVGCLVHEYAPLEPVRHTGAVPPADELRRRLLSSGLAEAVGGGSGGGGGGGGGGSASGERLWRACGAGLQLQHAWLAHSLGFVAARGFALHSAPLQPSAERLSKLDKMR